MKLNKSVLLSIALFGASASIFSYAAVYDVRGDDANALGNQFKSYLARAVNGDEIVLHNNVNLLRETGKLDIPNITIRSTNNSRLHIVGANLNLTGSAKFKDLNLSLRPDSGLNASFSGVVSGPDAMPTFIITNGNSLTLDNVNTKVDGDNDGTRPIILVGGGNSGENEVLTITNSTSESKLYSIVVDKTKKLNTAGNAFSTNDNPSEKEITINLDANSSVLNELNLAGIDKSQSPNNKISINSETLNIGKFGNSSKDGIRIGGAKNVNLTFSNVKNNLKEVKFVDDANINLKTLVLDGAEIVLKKDTNIGTLELKNEAKFNVESTPSYDDDPPLDYNIGITTLKSDTSKNSLSIIGNSSINVDALDGKPSHLNVTGIANNFKLKDNSKYDYVPNGTHGEFLPSVDELPPEETTPGNGEVDDKPADDPNVAPPASDPNSPSPSQPTEGDEEKTDDPAVTPVPPKGDSNIPSEDGKDKVDAEVDKEKNQGGDAPSAGGGNANTGTSDVTGGGTNGDATESSNSSDATDTGAQGGSNQDEPAADDPDVNNQADEPADLPKPAEKSIKDRIMDTLKGLFTENNLDEKQQQSAVEKTEESLNDLAATYTDYDFSFSLDAARVAENRLNDLAALNGLESAANDNYAFLAQSAKALKTHNSVWVSSSLAEQRGDRDSKRRLSTINLGYDRQFDNLIVGGFVSYLRQKGERGELSSKLHGYSLSLYGKYSQNAHEVVALLNVGRTKADLQRNISALSVSNNAETKGKFVGVRAEYGYRMVFEQHGLQVKPIVALNYNLGRQAAFTESGTMPVHVGKIKAQRLALEAGVELKKYFENAYVYLKPTVQTDLMARSNDVDVRFVDTPNSIPFKSTAKKKTYFALSLGTQVQLRKDLLLDLNANSRIGNHERDIQGSVKLSYKF